MVIPLKCFLELSHIENSRKAIREMEKRKMCFCSYFVEQHFSLVNYSAVTVCAKKVDCESKILLSGNTHSEYMNAGKCVCEYAFAGLTLTKDTKHRKTV